MPVGLNTFPNYFGSGKILSNHPNSAHLPNAHHSPRAARRSKSARLYAVNAALTVISHLRQLALAPRVLRETMERKRREQEERQRQAEREAMERRKRECCEREAALSSLITPLRVYEDRWAVLRSNAVDVEDLRVYDIPWPSFNHVRGVEHLTEERVLAFVLAA